VVLLLQAALCDTLTTNEDKTQDVNVEQYNCISCFVNKRIYVAVTCMERTFVIAARVMCHADCMSDE
jgi:hypothetical protein